jgi:hypothetical protein
MEEDDEFRGGGGEYGGGGGEYGGGGGEYGGGGGEYGGGGGELGGDGGGEFGGDEYGGAAAPPPPSEPPLHLHPSELSPPRSESPPPPPSEPALPPAGLAIGDDYGGGDQLNGEDYYGNGAGVVDYGTAAPPPPPEFSQQAGPPAARDEYMEPPSPMDPHCASMGGQSHASIGSIGEDIDVNSQGLVEETLERLSRVRGVLGVLILDGGGAVIRTTMEDQAVAKYSSPYATVGSNPRLLAGP